MKMLRIAAAVVTIAVGVVLLLLGLLYALGPGASRTVEQSRELAQSFKLAAQYVNAYKQRSGRFPSTQEFEVWASAFPSRPYSGPNGMQIQIAPFAEAVVSQFGESPQDGFLLTYWRGEWDEYYASWADRTSMEFDESKYYALGSKYIDGTALVVVSLLAFLGGRRMWPNRSLQPTASGRR